MAITKQTYTATPVWSASDVANLFRSAFIDAGLMTEWHDSFAISTRQFRVLKIDHDVTKTFGTSYYYFNFIAGDHPGVSLATGWDTTGKVPTGTQYLDYHLLPSGVTNNSNNWHSSRLTCYNPNANSDLLLHRYTSGDDPKQSWFTVQQGVNVCAPFSFLHPNTALYPWLDLDKGVVSGHTQALATVFNRSGQISFRLRERVGRSLLTGHTLRGYAANMASNAMHGTDFGGPCYTGLGCESNNFSDNHGPYNSTNYGGAMPLPIGRTIGNPAYAQDYIPICGSLPWSVFSPTPLASDFGIYMHYADNAIAFQDRFVVSPGVEEWEVVTFANNAVVGNGASPTFLARVV
jgi:hypothetical protein